MFRNRLPGAAHRARAAVTVAAVVAGVLTGALAGAAPGHAGTRTFSGIGVTGDGSGYGLISRAGEVYAFGSTVYHGNPAGFTGTIAGISVTANGRGYAAISTAGQVYAYGTVAYHGNPTGFSGSIAGISVTADGQGYAAISSTGQVYAYGTVAYHGNPTGFTGSIAGISVTADGQGYAAESSIGQVYAYGTVRYWGNGDPGSTLQDQIAAIGDAEHQNRAHNHEIPAGSNCNYYSYALGSGPAACANGWRAEPWCADFARWVWGQAGANVAGLNGLAISFERSAGGWHGGNLSGVQAGDVVGWNFGGSTTSDDHVSLVVGVNPDGSVNILDGNWSNAIGARTIAANAAVSGYAMPTS